MNVELLKNIFGIIFVERGKKVVSLQFENRHSKFSIVFVEGRNWCCGWFVWRWLVVGFWVDFFHTSSIRWIATDSESVYKKL